jgi:hypothetical protein
MTVGILVKSGSGMMETYTYINKKQLAMRHAQIGCVPRLQKKKIAHNPKNRTGTQRAYIKPGSSENH